MNGIGCVDIEDPETEPPSTVTTATGQILRFRYVIECADLTAGLCTTPRSCVLPPGTLRYDVYRSIDGAPFAPTGQTVCLTAEQAEEGTEAVLTPGMVLVAFRRLSWPAPEMVVQPPGGRTLVNFDTNFYTDLTEPQTQTVTLLGLAVTVEASPSSYTWTYGDGSATDTTSGPGSAYPDLDITHRYPRADVTVHPHLAVTYAGRYRVDGGPWQAIPGTVDVTGPARTLLVVSATPALVG